MTKDYVIGIDLGTTTTEAAIFRNGKTEMIINLNHEIVTPSAVGIDESGKFIIGAKAKAQYLLAPERTAIEIKRKLGTKETIHLGNQSFSPVELSAKLLAHVKYYASQYLGSEVSRAVISVPAYFDDIQRQEVVEAGRLAGLTVERIINEPTAAALSYGINHMDDESHILVYDLGGGTFDVTLLELFEGVLEVKASSGNNQLGGKDFDEALIQWLKNRFEEIHGIPLGNDPYTLARLKEKAEQCKIALSTQEEYTVELPFLAEKDNVPLGLDETVSRSQFEDLIRDLLENTHIPMQVVLDDSGISREKLDFVLLAGGSTRIPMVARDIEEFLGIAPKAEIHPDYSIAEGTAIQAAIISGELNGSNSIIMTDVNPYTLGVRVVEGFSDDCMSVIIPRNVTIPVTRHKIYYTNTDGQSTAHIEVYQGESRTASKNHRLGEFKVTDIPYAPAGEESVDVSFSYNQNGMLHVSAVLVSTGKEASISINMMDAESTKEERIDVSNWKTASISGDYRTVIRRAEKSLKHIEPYLDEEDKDLAEEIEEHLYRLKKAIIDEDTAEADTLEDYLLKLIEEAYDE